MATAAMAGAGNRSGVNFPDPASQQTRQPRQQSRDWSHLGVSDADRSELLECIRLYRDSWMADRIERFRIWTRNSLFRKGVQVLGWDPGANNWIDLLAWYRQSGRGKDEDTNLEPFISNVTLTCCNAFVTTLCGATPKTVILPNDVRVGADVVTAKAAKTAIQIVQRMNRMPRLIRKQFEMQFDFGCYFKHVRAVIDGDFAGWDKQAYFEDFQVTPGPRMKCMRCGTESSLDGLQQASQGQLPNCPNCGAPLGPESFYGGGEGSYTSLKMAGMREVPRAGVRISVHSPLEVDGDPKAEVVAQTPVLPYEREIDIGEARMMFPDCADSIREGAVSNTSSNAEYERLRRLEIYSTAGGQTADTNQSSVTFSEVWMQPQAFYRTGRKEFGDRMREAFPKGLCIANLGEETVDIREAQMTKEWTHCGLMEGYGLYPPAIAERVVPFNRRINAANQTVDTHAQTGSLGINVARASSLDTDRINKVKMDRSAILPIPDKINGEPKPIGEIFAHFDTPVEPQMWSYARMLYEFLMLIAELPPQVAGTGTTDGVDTAQGQDQMLQRALTIFRGYWENAKSEQVEADENTLHWLKKLIKAGAIQELWDVSESAGGGFSNETVAAQQLTGNARFRPDEDQGLPSTPEMLRSTIQSIFAQVGEGNPAAIAWMDEPANQEMAISSLVPGSVAPTEGQRIKTLSDLAMIVEMQVDPVNAANTPLPVMPDRSDDPQVAKEVTERYMQENAQLRFDGKGTWQRLLAYLDACLELDTQKKIDDAQRQMRIGQAGQPQKPGPSPNEQAMIGKVQTLAMQMLDVIAQQAQTDPMVTKGTLTAQVTAAKEAIEKGLEVTEMVSGNKA